jgi:hypothetical protein
MLTSVGFKWSLLLNNTLIVDVGGGIGTTSLEIAQANPHLRFLIQDKPIVIKEGQNISEPFSLSHNTEIRLA